MKRIVLMAVIISLASVPVAFADGPIVASAKQAAQQLATADAPRVNASAASAAAVQADSGMSGRTKLWIGIALAGVLAIGMKAMDNKIQDDTMSSARTRIDVGGEGFRGCKPWCGQ